MNTYMQQFIQWSDQTPFPVFHDKETSIDDLYDKNFSLFDDDLAQMLPKQLSSNLGYTMTVQKHGSVCLALRSQPRGGPRWQPLDCRQTTLPFVCKVPTHDLKPHRPKLETDTGKYDSPSLPYQKTIINQILIKENMYYIIN